MKSNYLNLIFLFFIRKIYRFFKYKITTSIDEYPIEHRSIKNFFDSLNNDKISKKGYFLRYFNSSIKDKYFLDNFFLLKYFHFFKYELFKGKILNSFSFSSYTNSYLLPITPYKNKKIALSIKYFKEKKLVKKNKIIIQKEKYTYLKLNSRENIKISSNNKFIQGNPLILNSKEKKTKKNVLLIFIDGLPSFNNILNFEELMPNTKEFFNEGIYFDNNFSTAEWTMPSFASIFTGLYSHKHKIYHPRKFYNVSKFETLSSLFKKEDYINFQIGSSARSNPAYGYCEGFDRLIYKRNMSCDDVIFNFLEHSNTFLKSNQFNLITLFDLHHFLNGGPSIMSQSKLDLDYLNLVRDKKSIHQEYNEIKIEILKNEIKRIDFHLSTIYNYIYKNYDTDEILIGLFSDHGYSYLSKKNEILSDDVTKVPLLIKDSSIKENYTNELTSNVDIFKTILKLSNIDYTNINNDSSIPSILGGNNDEKYIISESIYPDAPYHCTIRNNNGKIYFKTKQNTKNNIIYSEKYEYSFEKFSNKLEASSELENILLQKVFEKIKYFNS